MVQGRSGRGRQSRFRALLKKRKRQTQARRFHHSLVAQSPAGSDSRMTRLTTATGATATRVAAASRHRPGDWLAVHRRLSRARCRTAGAATIVPRALGVCRRMMVHSARSSVVTARPVRGRSAAKCRIPPIDASSAVVECRRPEAEGSAGLQAGCRGGLLARARWLPAWTPPGQPVPLSGTSATSERHHSEPTLFTVDKRNIISRSQH